MSADPKSPQSNPNQPLREKGVKVFTYPKIIFIFPTLVMSLICWVGMWMYAEKDRAQPDSKVVGGARTSGPAAVETKADGEKVVTVPEVEPLPIGNPNPVRFRDTRNVLSLIFLGVFFLNLLILAIDFPRFTIFALILLGTTVLFFLLWLGMFVRILEPLENMVQRVYVIANAQFYFVFSLIILSVYALIGATRWLDYWEILPNEILHHHGPLSDLERYPTLNLKFDKEIPDVFEHALFGAGRLVLHIQTEHRPIVLDTVLHVSRKEDALKKLMSRLEVRVTTDQEVAAPGG